MPVGAFQPLRKALGVFSQSLQSQLCSALVRWPQLSSSSLANSSLSLGIVCFYQKIGACICMLQWYSPLMWEETWLTPKSGFFFQLVSG